MIVNEAHEQWLVPWHPTIEERTQTRESSVIPTGEGTDGDWFVQAETWRETILGIEEEGVPEGEWPTPPNPRPPREATHIRFFTAPDLDARIATSRSS